MWPRRSSGPHLHRVPLNFLKTPMRPTALALRRRTRRPVIRTRAEPVGQSRNLRRRVEPVQRRRKNALVGWSKTVTNLAIRPLIRDCNFQFVQPWLQRGSDIDAIRWRPRQSRGLAIHLHLGDVAYLAEIDPNMLPRPEPRRRSLHGLRISRSAREILNPSIRAVGPRRELRHLNTRGRAPVRRKCNRP